MEIARLNNVVRGRVSWEASRGEGRRVTEMRRQARIQRCCTIMGRKDSDEMSAAQIMYPCMQCADIFYLKADICQLGMDQRKVRVNAMLVLDLVVPLHLLPS
eukprot:scaffold1803_cov261-Pinguiococcus_pyrenoidosus.AAC.5